MAEGGDADGPPWEDKPWEGCGFELLPHALVACVLSCLPAATLVRACAACWRHRRLLPDAAFERGQRLGVRMIERAGDLPC